MCRCDKTPNSEGEKCLEIPTILEFADRCFHLSRSKFHGTLGLNRILHFFHDFFHGFLVSLSSSEIRPAQRRSPPDMATTERLDAGPGASLANIATEDLTNANTITKWLLNQPETLRPA